jgi:hypothetical protein
MTRCRDVDRLATLYVDGELDDRRSSALRGHLRVCVRCAERVEDEARVRELASELEPIDPPAAMWKAIDASLAQEEIGDSRRSGMWLALQRLADGARRNALVMGLGSAAAVVALLVWLPGADDGRRAEPRAASVTPAQARTDGPTPPACTGARSHDELVLCQGHESDRRYLDAIAELRRALAEERTAWTADDASRFDSALAELDRAAHVERLRLAGQPASEAPANRDPLYTIYQAQIELLSTAVVAGDPIAAVARRGAP